MPISEAVLIIMGLLTVAMLAAGLCKNLPIPYTVFLVIIGMALGALARSMPQGDMLLEFQLTPEIVLFLFLPALLFESAFNLNARQLLKDIGPILTLAIPALLISTAIIGVGLWLVLGLQLPLALLFGALISATDPVAVIALFKELGAPERLTILVEGESLFNDATAIVVFNIILGIAVSGSFAFADAGLALVEFLRVFIGGILVGALMGFAISEIFHRFFTGLPAFVIMSVVVAYSSFTIAEHTLHVSGVMAVVAAAIALGALWVSRISQADTHVVKESWEVIALVSNSLLFLLVGLSVNVESLWERKFAIMIAVIFLLLARATTIYTLVPATIRFFKLPHVSTGERHIMWWGGLKGGLAIAIVLSIPEDLPGRDLLLDMTLGAVMFSLLVNAPTIRPLIQKFGIDKLTEDELSELKTGMVHASEKSSAILNRFYETDLVSRKTEQVIRKTTDQVFFSDAPSLGSEQGIRHLQIVALRAEQEELKHLHEIGLVQHYSYLAIKNDIQRDRERILMNESPTRAKELESRPSIFAKIEDSLLRRMREQDWAAGILSRYQNSRFSQRMQRDIAGVLICTSVLNMLSEHSDLDEDQRAQVAQRYTERLNYRKSRLRNIADDYPEFYARFENRLITQVALSAAGHHLEEEHREGEIGAKAMVRIERVIDKAMSDLPPISDPAEKLETSDLIGTVPLLHGLPTSVLDKLADKATAVTFLAGDTIIEEGQKGDALYIITRGTASVFKGSINVAELKDGEFFGEMALLSDQVRKATVKAKTSSALLRLRKRDVMQLADAEPELKSRLNDIKDEREAQEASIATIPLFKDVSPDLVEQVADQASTVTYRTGDTVIREGDRDNSLYIIIRGAVGVFKSGRRIAELGKGDFFGEMALLGDSIRTATVKAKEALTLAKIRQKEFAILSSANSELRNRLEQAQSSRNRRGQTPN
ncbi:MAG: cyclic nucleotide-binding domain-containing protein [Gammaproteobacteria bacterium]|nr:cyclic nucleotide-binding domain-containing protein [Gammaproteobacteria bacterium]